MRNNQCLVRKIGISAAPIKILLVPPQFSERRGRFRRPATEYDPAGAIHFVGAMMSFSLEPRHIGFLRKVQLKDLEFGHLDWKEMSPAHAHYGKKGRFTEETWTIHRPRSSAELTTFVSNLKSLQEGSPELEVVILGGIPKERVAVFQLKFKAWVAMNYIVPYPE